MKTKIFSLRITPELAKEIKIACAKRGITVKAVIENLLLKWLLEEENENGTAT